MFRQVIVIVLSLRCIFTQEAVLAFGYQGGFVEFEVQFTYRLSDKNFRSLLYKSSEDGLLLLMNSSDQTCHSGSCLPSRVNYLDSRFRMSNLSLLDSGRYVTERWRNGIHRENKTHDLTVCGDRLMVTGKIRDKIAEWAVKNFSTGHADRLLVYKDPATHYDKDITGKKTLILNTTLSLLGKQDNQSGEAKVLMNGSTIFISTDTHNLGKAYHFLIWSGEQCQGYGKYTFPQYVPGGGLMHSIGFIKAAENLTLPCHPSVKRMEVFHWKTPLGDIYIDRALPANITREGEKGMHVEPVSDSLIIPFLSAEHSGYYGCPIDPNMHQVFVCFHLETMYLTFSQGGSVALDCEPWKLNATIANCECYYQGLGQDWEKLIGHNKVNREAGMKSTGNIQLSLTVSNLTQNDSGQYYCRVWGYSELSTPFCYDRKIYLLHKHPFGIDSTFYRVYSSLMACGLLGMICAVISVHLRVRGRDQTSQERLRRTAEPSRRPTREEE